MPDTTHNKFEMNPSKIRHVRLKKLPKTYDLWGRQKSKPIKWGLNVTHPSNIVDINCFSYARCHSHQVRDESIKVQAREIEKTAKTSALCFQVPNEMSLFSWFFHFDFTLFCGHTKSICQHLLTMTESNPQCLMLTMTLSNAKCLTFAFFTYAEVACTIYFDTLYIFFVDCPSSDELEVKFKKASYFRFLTPFPRGILVVCVCVLKEIQHCCTNA